MFKAVLKKLPIFNFPFYIKAFTRLLTIRPLKALCYLHCVVILHFPVISYANTKDITEIIQKEEFLTYTNVAKFIDASPKVTILVAPEPSDIKIYGKNVKKSLTGSDCDRDGKMDDNAKCNATYVKLWLKYKL